MIKELEINEKLMIKLEKEDRLIVFRVQENVPRIIDPEEINFIKEKPSIMSRLKEGNIISVVTNGETVTSSILGTTGKGENIPKSIEDLDNNISIRRY